MGHTGRVQPAGLYQFRYGTAEGNPVVEDCSGSRPAHSASGDSDAGFADDHTDRSERDPAAVQIGTERDPVNP